MLEQQLDPQAQLQASMQERAQIAPVEVLYHSRRDDVHHRVYMHRSEEPILITNSNQLDRQFIQEESFIQLQRSRMQYIHLGILQVRIQTLHHQGVMALVVFRDNRWLGDQSILATMEIDLTRGSQMVYIMPDIMMTIGDFYKNIQITILTRGYDHWRNGEANLLITRGMVGRLSNTPNVSFEYIINGVVDYLISHGVRALPGRRYSTATLQGLDWVIRPSQVCQPLQPQEINSRNLIDGRVAISFTNYTATRTNLQPRFNDLDEEDMANSKIIVLLTEKHPSINVSLDYEYNAHETSACQEEFPFVLVHLISFTATMLERKSSGAAGFDLSTDADCVIEPRG
ncbi:hypothetical protein ZIOFF_039292 [Zingiber officinale]|uniref:Polyprotein n=1 Tax=Zingiber officinale TaxID=94328 RepID=A0A8J5G200_ZINOF|nr:hypothetical protein ZIOFF_039292 [Zingiber officinale]